LRKFFDSVFSLSVTFGGQVTSVVDALSGGQIPLVVAAEGEQLHLKTAVVLKKQIVEWLVDLEQQLLHSVKEQLKLCKEDLEENVEKLQTEERSAWIDRFNTQSIVTVSQYVWTREIE